MRCNSSNKENFINKKAFLRIKNDFVKKTRIDDSKIIGNKVGVGQGCIYVANRHQKLESYGFDTCAPFIMLTQDGKQILGHIDSFTKPEEIVEVIKRNFATEEIKNAFFHYFEGADTLAPGQNLRQLAINTINEALRRLGVQGTNHGRLTPFDNVIVDSSGIKLKRWNKIQNILV